ncbi:hypothetical protein QAD02_005568 [Eretmocerus hayati]|uniref:Uncharacterized protein n=1 Tax=Eretmocerus hayati TaxID=131215 RepID=A0ACC2NUM1_9HYME|nr:hypothetical protein QAD02_005568 [Eretmocerus hayati]
MIPELRIEFSEQISDRLELYVLLVKWRRQAGAGPVTVISGAWHIHEYTERPNWWSKSSGEHEGTIPVSQKVLGARFWSENQWRQFALRAESVVSCSEEVEKVENIEDPGEYKNTEIL